MRRSFLILVITVLLVFGVFILLLTRNTLLSVPPTSLSSTSSDAISSNDEDTSSKTLRRNSELLHQQLSRKNSNFRDGKRSSSSSIVKLPDPESHPEDVVALMNKNKKKSSSFKVTAVHDCDANNDDQHNSHNNNNKEKQWLLVIGIPSVDRAVSLERRNRQRETWFRYSSVHDTILPRYLLGLHPAHNYQMSKSLQNEISDLKQKDDIIVFDLKEGKPNNKTVGGGGYWGLEAEVGMSRKAYFWYVFASQNYRNADFIAKADDDLFLRANLISSILNEIVLIASSSSQLSTKRKVMTKSAFAHQEEKHNSDDDGGEEHNQLNNHEDSKDDVACPHNNLYWGRVMKWGAKKGDPTSKYPFVGGMFILMSRPLVRWIASSPIPAVNSQEPFRGDGKEERHKYKETSHDHEDVMVGKWFYRAKLPVCVISDCRFHDVHVGANLGKVRHSSIGMHHLKVEEYSQFMSKYPDVMLSNNNNSHHSEENVGVVKKVTKDAINKLANEDSKKTLQGYAKMYYMC